MMARTLLVEAHSAHTSSGAGFCLRLLPGWVAARFLAQHEINMGMLAREDAQNPQFYLRFKERNR